MDEPGSFARTIDRAADHGHALWARADWARRARTMPLDRAPKGGARVSA